MDKLKQYIQANREKLDMDEPAIDTWDKLSSQGLQPGTTDPLKAHIEQYSHELDIDMPGAAAWAEIKKGSRPATKSAAQISKQWRYVAAACVLVFLGVAILYRMNTRQNGGIKNGLAKDPVKIIQPPVIQKPTVAEKTEVAVIPETVKTKLIKHAPAKNAVALNKNTISKRSIKNPLPEEIEQMENDYGSLIAGQVNYIQSLPVYRQNLVYFTGFVDDFKRLDFQEKELRKSIISAGFRDNSLEDLALIYEQKLVVLKKLQEEVNRSIKRGQNERDTIPGYIKL